MKISKIMLHDAEYISDILKENGISQKQILERSHEIFEKKLLMLDKKSEEQIQQFKSVSEAAQYCINNNLSKDNIKGISAHISQCCNKIRKTAYGYKWKYL